MVERLIISVTLDYNNQKPKAMKTISTIKMAATAVLIFITSSVFAATWADEDVISFPMVDEKPTVSIDGKQCGIQDYMTLMMTQKVPEGCTTGKVMCSLIIGPNGSVKDVKVIRSVDEATDAAAVKLLKTTGTWTPGKQRGEPVAVSITIPVIFR